MSSSKQIDFWRGSFGDEYSQRNNASNEAVRARVRMWATVLRSISHRMPTSMLEAGANIGINIRALRALTTAELFAVEPNATARQRMLDDDVLKPSNVSPGTCQSLPFQDGQIELVFTSGVLIHIAPDDLLAACNEIHRVSGKYIACAEYFSQHPQSIEYRGHDGYLFKRDFGGFWLDNFDDLELVDYGFFWKRATGLDDLTWWLFEKRS